jgi:hypothetical protein
MKNAKNIILSFYLTSSVFCNAYAQKARIFGAQINYTKTDSSTFDVRYTILLSSEDSAFSASQISCYINCPLFVGSRIKLPAPMLVSAKKEFPSGYCTPVKKLNHYVFSSIINLNYPFFANVKNCCELRFEMEACCRDSLINVFTGDNMFIYAEVNNCGPLINKSSIAFTADLEATACCNQPFYYQMGVADTSEFDSLSYTFETPMINLNGDNVVYDSGYYANKPLDVYYLSPLKYPYININANPPMGLYLDPEMGDLIFTPVTAPQTSSFAIKITEWRKNSSGLYQKVGSTIQEKRMSIVSCNDNYPPQITNTEFTYRTCAGERICFNVTTDDKVFIPPPPLQVPPPDKVHLTWNRGIPGATFSIINKDSLHESARFCWAPGKQEGNNLPYTFIATAEDDFCPLHARTIRTFRVFVKHEVNADRMYSKHVDGRIFVSAVSTGIRTVDSILWTILDQMSNVIFDTSLAHFSSSKGFWSSKMTDNLFLKNSGTYILNCTVNAKNDNCPQTYYDTLYYNALGFDNLKAADQIILYPNPCQDKLQIRSSGLGLMAYQVVDINGRLILQGSIDNHEESLDISNLNSGVYNLTLSDGSKQFHKRFVKIP